MHLYSSLKRPMTRGQPQVNPYLSSSRELRKVRLTPKTTTSHWRIETSTVEGNTLWNSAMMYWFSSRLSPRCLRGNCLLAAAELNHRGVSASQARCVGLWCVTCLCRQTPQGLARLGRLFIAVYENTRYPHVVCSFSIANIMWLH